MKKIIYSFIFVMACILGACEDDLPQASWNLYEVNKLTAVAGDGSVKLNWQTPAEANPSGYYLTWAPSSSAYKGGNMSLDAAVTEVVVENLENKIAYTFALQAVYGHQRSGKVTAKATPVTSLIPPTNLEALAGSEKAKITWTKPTTANVKGYKITVNSPLKIQHIG